MSVEINWWAVILATLSTMVIGTIWYARPAFGNLWIKLARVDTSETPNMVWPILTTLVVSFITATALAHFAFIAHVFFQNSFMADTLTTAFWVWVGFVAARFITHDAFENRPSQLTILNIAHELVTIVVMGLIIGAFKP